MPDTPHQDRPPPLHGGELPTKRSYGSLLWYLEALSEQRPSSTADDVPDIQRIGKFGIGCDNDDAEYNEGYRCWKRCPIQGECHQGFV